MIVAPAPDPAASAIRAAVRVALAASILGFAPGLLDSFTVPKAVALRAIGLPMMAFVLLEALLTRRAPRHPLDGVVLAWLVAATLSTFFGISPRLSISGEIGQREGLLTGLALAGLYFGARRGHLDGRHVRGTLLVVVGSAAVAAAYAMLQRAGLDPLVWANPPSYRAGEVAVPRPFATLGNPILLGLVLAPAFAAGLAMALSAAPRPAWLVPALVLTAAAAASTLSRGTLLAAAAGAGVAAAAALRAAAPPERRRGLITLAWIAIPAAVWSWAALRAPLAARAAESLSTSAESGPARLEIAKSALALWRSRPLFGVGPDAFGLAFPAVQTPDYWRNAWIGNPVHAHSVPMQALATGGTLAMIVGAVWLVALVIAWLRGATGNSEPAVTAELGGGAAPSVALLGGLVALVIGGCFNAVGLAGAAIFVALSALTVSVARTGEAPAETHPAVRPRLVGWLAAAGAVAALVITGLSLSELRALTAANDSHNALEASIDADPAERAALAALAASRAALATTLMPSEDELWRLRSDSELAAGGDSLAAAAERSARRALALEPRRAMNLQRLANALSARGEHDRAASAFDETRRLAPYDALVLVDRVRAELGADHADRALQSARAITGMYPDEAIGYSIEAATLISLGRPSEAQDVLERALASRWEEGSDPQRQAAEQTLRMLRQGEPLHPGRAQKGLLRSPEKR